MQNEAKGKSPDELNDKPFLDDKNFHLAGIIPVAGHKLDFGMEWDESLAPICPNYTLIENAVYQKHIPIFYTPVHPKDRDKRDCLAWSVLHGAVTCLKVSDFLSKWVKPDKYYVSFPFSVFYSPDLRKHRRQIRSKNNFYVTKNGLSVEDNLYASFTFGKEEFVKYRRIIRQKGTGMYDRSSPKNEMGRHIERLPLHERYSARHFDLSDVFIDLDLSNENFVEPAWYYNIGSWDEYCTFLSSEESKKIKRPNPIVMSYREFNKIGLDNQDET
jgi:hypothetical protein